MRVSTVSFRAVTTMASTVSTGPGAGAGAEPPADSVAEYATGMAMAYKLIQQQN